LVTGAFHVLPEMRWCVLVTCAGACRQSGLRSD
jgi:hypothetical protein